MCSEAFSLAMKMIQIGKRTTRNTLCLLVRHHLRSEYWDCCSWNFFSRTVSNLFFIDGLLLTATREIWMSRYSLFEWIQGFGDTQWSKTFFWWTHRNVVESFFWTPSLCVLSCRIDRWHPGKMLWTTEKMATMAGLEPATSGVTGRHSDQLSYMAIWNA